MKLSLFIIASIICPVLAAQQVAVQLSAMNVLYEGLDNPLQVAIAGIKADKVIVKGENMQLIHVDGNRYMSRVTAGSNRTAVLYIGYKKGRDTIWCDTSQYRIKKVPSPEARFGGLSSGTYARAQILAQNRLLAYMEGFVFEGVSFKVTSFELQHISSYFRRTIKIEGDKVDPSDLHPLLPGDMLMFQRIEASYGSRINKNLEALLIEVASEYEADSVMSCFNYDQTLSRTEISKTDPSRTEFKRYLKIGSVELLLAESVMEDDAVIYVRAFYSNGKEHFVINNAQDSIAEFSSYYPNGNIRHKGQVLLPNRTINKRNAVLDDKYVKRPGFPYRDYADTVTFADAELNYFTPIGYWQEYYPNGKLHLEGTYASYEATGGWNWHIIDPAVYYKLIHRSGTWKFYDQSGRHVISATYGSTEERGRELKKVHH